MSSVRTRYPAQKSQAVAATSGPPSGGPSRYPARETTRRCCGRRGIPGRGGHFATVLDILPRLVPEGAGQVSATACCTSGVGPPHIAVVTKIEHAAQKEMTGANPCH